MSYMTQMEAARKGIFTKEMEIVLKEESISKKDLMEKMAQGKIVIPANKNHKSLSPKGIGEGLKTKINVNLGVSEDCCDQELELEKVMNSIKLGADAIMDLSTFGDTRGFRRKLADMSPAALGTVPMYDAVAKYGKDIASMTVEDLFKVVEEHCEDGMDFLTIHAGLNLTCVERLQKNNRLTKIVSRGGSILYEWMIKNNKENPFYEHYDRLLDICRKYDVTLSLGDGLRPGSLKDATDAPQIQELIILGELTKAAWEKDVQVMIEGPGHVPLNEIATNMQLEKKLCHGAPFYVLGPIVTDIAPGYDHITSAIGGAIAASNGADFLCYVTPAEHLRLPTAEDVKEGIIASKIAAHVGDIAKGIKGAIDWDHAMSEARGTLNWQKMFDLCIDREKAIEYRRSVIESSKGEACTMCGDLCPIKRCNEIA
ncbi:phosphomethylpyrimidine synthase ThiC [Ilyobacter polytropus]|uniref:Phosphomethylpyrimidine synthase n=1 Tax=Ilyobacter polytropus (strain ATCC 51220 / DSM 2926 / LMG 16218 / CuHBu1) TaxID=572544 RepID=E3H8I0_ILYPC|nr:phosphomethylpyrimidine synthase ThiC [Ilyobacter polytropus]ADO82962.1 hydroxymethylpyrimidine synthase [Ilyobacter polytropus DSM 2926]